MGERKDTPQPLPWPHYLLKLRKDQSTEFAESNTHLTGNAYQEQNDTVESVLGPNPGSAT